MFRKKEKKLKKVKKLDKLIKGIIIGGAIGSAIGVTVAPKTGKETRRFLADTSKAALEKGSGIIKQYQPGKEKKKVSLVGGFFRGIRALLLGKKK